MYVRNGTPKYLCRKCNNKIPIADLEGIFHDELEIFFTDPTKIAGYLKEANQAITEKTQMVESQERSIQRLREEMSKTHRLFLEGHLTPQGFADLYKPAEEQLNQITKSLPKLQADLDYLKMNQLSTDVIVKEASSLYSRWPSLPTDEKRAIAESLCQKIVIGRGEIDITLSYLPTSEELCKTQQQL